MTKEQLQRFAEAGVREHMLAMERELRDYHRTWPALFKPGPPPQFVAAARKNGNGNGRWPAIEATAPAPEPDPKNTKAMKSAWTPARRAKQARMMRSRLKTMQAAKRAKAAAKIAANTRPPISAATRRKLALAMKRRHASGEMAKVLGHA
jgi:hypothetical protein